MHLPSTRWLCALLVVGTLSFPDGPTLSQTLERDPPPCSKSAVAEARAGAQANNAAAIYKLARYYSTGKCIAGDGPQAIALYNRAAELGYAAAYYNLGVLEAGGAKNYHAAEGWWVKGAELGHRGCQLQLGILYSAPIVGVADDAKAYAWLSLVIRRGDPDADLARTVLKPVKRRLSASDRARGEAYLADLQSKYGSPSAPRP
jgi:TPR repeat protein